MRIVGTGLLLCVSCACALAWQSTPALEGYFTGGGARWSGHGGSVPVSLDGRHLRIGEWLLEHEGGSHPAPAVQADGVVRRVRPDGTTTLAIARSMEFPGIYPGVTLRLSFQGNTLKSDYLVRAHADPSAIRFRFLDSNGQAAQPSLDSGDLVIGGIRQPAPVAWQDGPSGRQTVQARFVPDAGGWVRFALEGRDPGLPLTIDPYVIGFAGVYGGTGRDSVAAIATDSSGKAYLAGLTDSADFPASPLTAGSGDVEAFVMKVDPASNRVLWATYVGASGYDAATAIRLDTAGNIIVAGSTYSPAFPVKPVTATRNAGGQDGFVLKLDTNGAVVFSTCFGGTGTDSINGIAITGTGDIWAVGQTTSADLPVLNSIQSALAGSSDAFVARFTSAGALASSTYYGGSGTDSANAVAVDTGNAVYFTGTTTSLNFPVTGGFQTVSPGAPDAFVAKINAAGSSVVYSSYLGGSPRQTSLPETGTAIAVDSSGAAWVAGTTSAFDFPSLNPLQTAFGGGTTDAFLTKVAPSGGSLLFSTLIGGTGTDEGNGIAIHPDGSVSMAGSTTSPDLPVVGGAGPGGAATWDGFVLKIDPAAKVRLLESYLGGGGTDTAVAIAASGAAMFVAGTTTASSAWLQGTTVKGSSDSYLIRMDEFPAAVQLVPGVAAASYMVSGSGCEPGTYSVNWVFSWTMGAQCTVTAAATVGTGESRSRFTGWSDGSTANPRTFIATASQVLTMNYVQEHHVIQLVSPAGAGTITAAPASADGWYAAGTQIQLTATPTSGYAFTGWTGVASSGLVQLSAPVSATATFQCVYSLSSAVASPTSAAVLLAPSVTTGAGCFWTATSSAAWITITAGASGTGSGTVQISVAANTSSAVRSGTVTIGGQVYTITQAGIPVVSVNISVAYPGYSYTIAGTGCDSGTYSGSRVASWLTGSQCTITAVPSVTADQTRYRFISWSDGAVANPRTFAATAGLTSIGLSLATDFRVTSSVAPAGAGSMSLTPASADGWYQAGTTITGGAAAAAGYAFSGWSGSSSTGSVVLTGPAVFTANFGCTYSVTPTTLSSSGAVTLTTGATCSWSASPSVPWIGVSASAGTGSASVNISVAANGSDTARTGTVTIGGRTITVTQPAGCTFALSPSSVPVVPADGKGTTITITASGAGCTWNATTTSTWMEIFPQSGTGSGTTTVTAYPNFSSQSRSGSITIGNQQITLTQAASTLPEPSRFVQFAYFGYFGRLPGASEIDFQVQNALNKGMSRVDFLNNMFNSNEFNVGGRFVAGIYVGLLDRDPEYAGWRFQRKALMDGYVDQTSLVRNFVTSAEYTLHWGNPTKEEFVRLLYRYILLREASQDEVNFQANALGDGSIDKRVVMAQSFLNSAEFRAGAGPRLVAFALYATLLQRDGQPAERSGVAAQIKAGAALKDLIAAFYNSGECQAILK